MEANPRKAELGNSPSKDNPLTKRVMANRLWEQLMGRGLVARSGDWEKSPPTHPKLLRWLGHELARNDYSLKALARLILNSHAYQRSIDPVLRETSPLFSSPARRRLRAPGEDGVR